MPKEIDGEIFKLHDERLSEHDKRFAGHERSFQEIEDQIKYMIGRLDNGISPSVNEVRKDNVEIKEKFTNLEHKLELSMRDMKDLVQNVQMNVDVRMKSYDSDVIEPMKKQMNTIQGVLFYGLVASLIAFAGQQVLKKAWEKFFDRPTRAEAVAELKAVPLRK